MLKSQTTRLRFIALIGLIILLLGVIISPFLINGLLLLLEKPQTLESLELKTALQKLRITAIIIGSLVLTIGSIGLIKPELIQKTHGLLKRFENLDEKKFAIAITLIFLISISFIALHHEMWRDELQAWLIASDSSSPIEVLRHLKYEGHPGVWHLALFLLSRISSSPLIMKLFHIVIATTSIYIISRYSPFTKIQKTFLVFSYFPLYEYGVIARNYAPGILLLVAICSLFPHRKKRFLLISFLLLLLAHTHVLATILAMSLSITFLISFKISGWPTSKIKTYGGFSLIFFGIITAVIQLNPPPDSGSAVGWVTGFDLGRAAGALSTPAKAYLPIPIPYLHFWNNVLPTVGTNAPGVIGIVGFIVSALLSAALLLMGILMIMNKPAPLTLFLIGNTGLLAFFYMKKPGGAMRFNGFLFFLFIASLWISHYSQKRKLFSLIDTFTIKKSSKIILTSLLIIHFIGGAYAISIDWTHDFSKGKKVANFIKKKNLQDKPIIGYPSPSASTVAGYLNRELYYVEGHRRNSFVVWDTERWEQVSTKEIITVAKQQSKQKDARALILLNQPLEENTLTQHSLTKIKTFKPAIVGSEEYYLYSTKSSLEEP